MKIVDKLVLLILVMRLEASTYLAQTDDYLYAITKEGEHCGVAAFKKKLLVR